MALGFAATTALLLGLTMGGFGLPAGISHLTGLAFGARGSMKAGVIGAVVGMSAGTSATASG